MSAIAKPHFFFSTATPAAAIDRVIECENVKQIEKLDLPANGTGNPAKSQILVTYKTGTPKSETFTFASSGARNTAFSAAKTLLAASV